jgi:dihydropteroate synthase
VTFANIPLPHGRILRLATPQVMGVVNVTPDSFSDGGHFASVPAAVAHGVALVREGAGVLDIGGESTRPTAAPVGASEEMARVLPVLRALAAAVDVPLSVDTMKAEVAAAAIEAGASIVNDVWGFQRDPQMARVVAAGGAAAILMHNRGHDGVDPDLDIVADVLRFLQRSVEIGLAAGIAPERMIVDPGFGFGKTDLQNMRLVRDLRRMAVLGCPILLGVSRKSSIGRIADEPVAAARLPGSLAAALCGVRNGAAIIRVHDVGAHVQALKIMAAIGETALAESAA